MISGAQRLGKTKEQCQDYVLHQQGYYRKKGQKQNVLGSSPGEGSFCSSETKHDRRTAPRPKMFLSVVRLQEQKPQPQKIVLGSSPRSTNIIPSNYPFEFKHFYFPFKLCFTMIITKAQGQSLKKKVGMYFRVECFSHMWLAQQLVLQKLTYTGPTGKSSNVVHKEVL
jgi:hypothetical protein